MAKIHTITLNDRELATILASLRATQNVQQHEPLAPEIVDIATNYGALDALNHDEVDQLCERINSGSINPTEPPDDGFKAQCLAAGWRWYDNSSVLASLTGHTHGIAHEPTTEGDANENDSIYGTWKDCANEALGIDDPLTHVSTHEAACGKVDLYWYGNDYDYVRTARANGVLVSQNEHANVGTWKWRARNGFFAGPFDTEEAAAEDACRTLGFYEGNE